MLTRSQLLKNLRIKQTISSKTSVLNQNPQRKAVCIRIFIRTPKKPNSALRKLARVRLANNAVTTAYIPGEGHNLIKFSTVLLEGGRVKDLPGIRYHLIRGKFDFEAVFSRRQARSKYGTKRWKR